MDLLGVNNVDFLRVLRSFLTTNLADCHTYSSAVRKTIYTSSRKTKKPPITWWQKKACGRKAIRIPNFLFHEFENLIKR